MIDWLVNCRPLMSYRSHHSIVILGDYPGEAALLIPSKYGGICDAHRNGSMVLRYPLVHTHKITKSYGKPPFYSVIHRTNRSCFTAVTVSLLVDATTFPPQVDASNSDHGIFLLEKWTCLWNIHPRKLHIFEKNLWHFHSSHETSHLFGSLVPIPWWPWWCAEALKGLEEDDSFYTTVYAVNAEVLPVPWRWK